MSPHPVYVISGVAGSGKTTLAHAWAPTMGAAIVDLDVVAANVVDTALHEHPEARPWQINAAYRAQRYRCLIDAISSARRSATVMAVAPFTQGVTQALRAIKGKKTKSKITTGFTILTDQNVNTNFGQKAAYRSEC